MSLKWGSALALTIVIIFGGTWKLLAQSVPVVAINELAWAGSSLSPSDEWIELINTTDAEIDISGWQLTKLTSGEETVMLTLPEASLIASNGYFLISNFDATESIINVPPDVVDVAVALANTTLQIRLYDGDFATGANRIDEAGDGGTPPAGDNALKISMERKPDFNGWQDASARTNLDEGATELATPQAPNSEIVLPPTLVSMAPTTAMNDTALTIEAIVGTNFSVEPVPTLVLKLGAQEFQASDIHVADTTSIDAATFNIIGAEAGTWDLILTNPDNQTATLPAALTITEPEPEFDMSTSIRISEIYPRPNSTSNDEFIELYNFGDTTIALAGWQLDDIADGGSNPHDLAGTIAPKSFLTIYKPDSRITLNDVGDTVRLLQPTGFVLDEIAYTDAPKGQSLARFDNGWEWTETVTPNGVNVLTQTEAPGEDEDLEPDDEVVEDEVAMPTYAPNDLLITELMPNPATGEEFIEIYNASANPITLTGWKLRDASGKQYTIGDADLQIQSASVILPKQFVYIVQSTSGIQLNNTGGERVELIAPNGTIIAAASYPDKAPLGAAYAHYGESSWTWTSQPTPGRANIVVLAEDLAPASSSSTPVTTTLPSAGTYPRQWWGIILMSLSLASMLVWYRYAYEIHHD